VADHCLGVHTFQSLRRQLVVHYACPTHCARGSPWSVYSYPNVSQCFAITKLLCLLGVVILFSVIVLALAAALINTTESLGFYYVFSALALAVSILTLLAVGLM